MPDVTIKTNKDIYAAVGINGYPSEFCTDMRFYDPEHGDILIPAGTEFTVIDIFINRMEEMFGQSHTAFFCTCDYVDFYDMIRLEDCDDQF